MINYGLIKILGVFAEKTFNKLFKISGSSTFVLIFSMLTGFPSSAKYISALLKEDLISIEESNKIIRFTHFSNPLFIINTIGVTILKNKLMGYFILTSHFLSNFVIAFLYRNEPSVSITNNSFKQEKFGKILSKSIINSFNSLLIILGNLIIFKLIIKIAFYYLNFNAITKAIISLVIELTNGLFSFKNINFNFYLKSLLITSAISFGGICIHSQVYSILSDTKVKYTNYLSGRILQALISAIILTIILICHRI